MYENTELGTYVDYDLLTETYTEAVTGRQLYELLGKSTIDKYGLTYYVDGVVNTTIDAKNMIRGNNVEYKTTDNGVLTQVFVDHDDEEIIITSINTYLAQANSNYNSTNETLSLKVFQKDDTGTTKIVDVADVPNIADITEDQFVLVNLSGKGLATGAYDVVKVSDVEIMSDATVTKFSKASNGKIASKLTVDGEEYSASQMAYYDKDVLDVYDQQLLTDMSYNIYLDQYGYAIGVDLFEGTKNYVFITGYDRGKSYISVKTAQAGAIFLDGRMEEITVNVTDTNKNIDRMDGVVNNACSDPYFELWGATSETANGKLNENRWYTYTENNGVYTLKPCENMFATNLANGTVIKSAYVYLDDTVKNVRSRAYGNDDSIYITVEPGKVDESGLLNNAITDTNGLYTGVQNVDIEMTTAARGDVSEANIYTLYDDDHYIIASIVLGEAQGSIANYAYILGEAKNEELRSDGYYYWQFDAVVGGEKVTLTAKTKYTSVFSGLRKFHVQELRYDGEYVTAVKDVDNSKIYTNNSFDIKKQDVYDVGHVHTSGMDTGNGTGCTLGGTRIDGSIVLEGRTLYTTNAYGTRDVGLALASDAKAVLIQYEGTSTNYMDNRTVSNCGSVSEAIGRLADRDTNKTGTQFKGRIVAVLNSAGVAQWVVIISDTPLIIGGGSTPTTPGGGLLNEFTMNSPTNYTVRYYGYKTLAELQTYVTEVVERNTGMTVREYNPATGLLLFDGTIAWPVQVTTQRMAAFKIDGVVKQYVEWNKSAVPGVTPGTQAVTLPAGNYLLKGTVAGTTPITGTYTVSANTTADDIELVTAYSVLATNNSNGTHRTTITYTDAAGSHVLTQGSGTYYFAKGTAIKVTGQVATLDWQTGADKHATLRYFENILNGANEKLNDYQVVLDTDDTAGKNGAVSMTYYVTKDVQISESTDYAQVIIDGNDFGYKDVYNDVVAFTAPATARFARVPKMYDKGGALLKVNDGTKGNIYNHGNGAFTYDINPEHTDERGVISLVQAAAVTVSGGSATYNGATVTTGYLVKPGDVLTFTGVTGVTVNSTPLAATSAGVVVDSTGTWVSYTVQPGDNAITIN